MPHLTIQMGPVSTPTNAGAGVAAAVAAGYGPTVWLQPTAGNAAGTGVGNAATTTGIQYTDYTAPGGSTTIAALQSFLNGTVPNGTNATHQSRVMLPAGAIYTGTPGLSIAGRSWITFEGNGVETTYGHTGGAKLKLTGAANDTANSGFFTGYGTGYQCTGITFHCLTVEGSSTDYASVNAGEPVGYEYQAAWALFGAKSIEISHCISDKCKGDGLRMEDGAPNNAGSVWCDQVYMHNSTVSNNGRMGVAVVAGSNVRISYVTFSDMSWSVLDIEPDGWTPSQGATNVEFDHNVTTGRYAWDPRYTATPCFNITGVGVCNGFLSIHDNAFGAYQSTNSNRTAAGMNGDGSVPTKTGLTLTFTNNTCSVSHAGPVLLLQNFTGGATVTNNTGHLSSGSFISDLGGNGTITQSGNT